MPIKIIYLDDEPELLDIFSDLFSDPTIEIKTFTKSTEAVDEINANPPDLLILDYRLPGTNGDLIAQALDPNIPKILLTGDLSVSVSSKFLKVFYKPYDTNEMSELIRSFIPSNNSDTTI
jgi:DNA-binding response OmpR family regulator